MHITKLTTFLFAGCRLSFRGILAYINNDVIITLKIKRDLPASVS